MIAGNPDRMRHLARPTTTNFLPRPQNIRSTAMYTMHEALARDRMRELEQRSRSAELARGLAAQRRWHRVSLYAQAAHARYARRVGQLTEH